MFVLLYRSWFESRYGRSPSPRRHGGYAPHFLRVSQIGAGGTDERGAVVGPGQWIPQCDRRIPLRDREPQRWENCRPGQAQIPWMRDVIKWHLGTALDAGTLTWSTVLQRCPDLLRFDRWLSTLDDPAAVCRSLDNAGRLAASFHPGSVIPQTEHRSATRRSAATQVVNPNLRAVADLMAFIAGLP